MSNLLTLMRCQARGCIFLKCLLFLGLRLLFLNRVHWKVAIDKLSYLVFDSSHSRWEFMRFLCGERFGRLSVYSVVVSVWLRGGGCWYWTVVPTFLCTYGNCSRLYSHDSARTLALGRLPCQLNVPVTTFTYIIPRIAAFTHFHSWKFYVQFLYCTFYIFAQVRSNRRLAKLESRQSGTHHSSGVVWHCKRANCNEFTSEFETLRAIATFIEKKTRYLIISCIYSAAKPTAFFAFQIVLPRRRRRSYSKANISNICSPHRRAAGPAGFPSVRERYFSFSLKTRHVEPNNSVCHSSFSCQLLNVDEAYVSSYSSSPYRQYIAEQCIERGRNHE